MSGIRQETVAVIGTGIALAVLIVPGLGELRRDMGDVRERLARIEGMFDVFARREPEEPRSPRRPARLTPSNTV